MMLPSSKISEPDVCIVSVEFAENPAQSFMVIVRPSSDDAEGRVTIPELLLVFARNNPVK